MRRPTSGGGVHLTRWLQTSNGLEAQDREVGPMKQSTASGTGWTVGLDVSDRYTQIYGVDSGGMCVVEGRVRTTPTALRRWFEGHAPMRVVLEVGTHSPWVSRVIALGGHEVLVANARKLRLIYQN